MHTVERSATDPAALRHAMSQFATGVAVITSRDFLGRPVGTTVNALSSLSLDPPLVLVCLSQTSRTLEALRQHCGFAVNVLSEDQQPLAELFAQPGSAGDWPEGDLLAADVPHVDGALAVVECGVHEIINGGDHDIVLGAVVHTRVRDDRQPLLFHGDSFKQFVGLLRCREPARAS
jgi:flavin reductase (DIM6/NTAB) family NADH-FMN oxidoreductase RutF